jgi:hypothetical protein
MPWRLTLKRAIQYLRLSKRPEKIEKWQKRVAELSPPPPEAPPPEVRPPERMWRYTLALNYVIHHRYYSAVCQMWALRREDLDTWEAEQRLREHVRRKIGYDESNWWFPDVIVGEALQEVPYDPDLVGHMEIRDEFVMARPRKPKPKIAPVIK